MLLQREVDAGLLCLENDVLDLYTHWHPVTVTSTVEPAAFTQRYNGTSNRRRDSLGSRVSFLTARGPRIKSSTVV